VSRTERLSHGWLIIISIIIIKVALPVPANAMPAANQNYIKHEVYTQSTPSQAKTVPGKITCQIEEGDTFITILTSHGVSMADALYASKKSDKKIIKKIRPGGEIDLRMNRGKSAVIEIGYSKPSSKRKIIYSGKAISISPNIVGIASKVKLDNKTQATGLAEHGAENLITLPGMDPEELSKNIFTATTDNTYCSVFNAPPDIQARIKKETRDMNKQLLKAKNEKKNHLRLAKIKQHNERMQANRKVKENARYAYAQKNRNSILASYQDESESDMNEDSIDNTVTNDNPELREKLINVADTYKGVPYKRGGATSTATDCSGLTMQVYRDMGLNLPRSSREQFHVGAPRKKEDLEKGDLVFFSTNSPYKKIKIRSKKNPRKKIVKYINAPRRITHVGIYVGDGKFIHAPRPGHTVTVESLDTNYYRKNYVGARSVIR
jgi:cell wall-associated NlpC family hydrolase